MTIGVSLPFLPLVFVAVWVTTPGTVSVDDAVKSKISAKSQRPEYAPVVTGGRVTVAVVGFVVVGVVLGATTGIPILKDAGCPSVLEPNEILLESRRRLVDYAYLN